MTIFTKNRFSNPAFNLTLTLMLTVSFTVLPTVSAYSYGEGGGGNESDGSTGPGVSSGETAGIAADIGGASKTCVILPIEYRADCLAQSLRSSVRKVKKKVYIPVKGEIQATAQSIEDIVTENLDEDAPVIKVGNKTYRPIKKEVVESVNQQVTKVIAESATRLIRSAGNSVTRKIHFQKIAKALNSTKVLLRAA